MKLILLPCWCGLFFLALSIASATPTPAIDWSGAIYVSPAGDDGADGTRERPVATLATAQTKLPREGKGVIALLGGIYREAVELSTSRAPAGLTVAAVPGEKVIFDGSQELTNAEETDQPGNWRVTLETETTGRGLNLWSEKPKVRYQEQLDAAGVSAWPESFCRVDEKTVLVHTGKGKSPASVGLKGSRSPLAIKVMRSRVAINGISFRNYLGDRFSAAIEIRPRRKHFSITDCDVQNTVRGIVISLRAQHGEIANCRFRDVGIGINQTGSDVVIRDCVIFSAMGRFAIESEINRYEHNGIRNYHPASRTTISNCLTAGFSFGGIRTKTGEGRGFLFENNTSLDGFRWEGSQEFNRYVANVSAGGKGRLMSLIDYDAEASGNYFFDAPELVKRGENRLGPQPFRDLDGPAPRFDPQLLQAADLGREPGARLEQLMGGNGLRLPALVAAELNATPREEEPLRFLEPPIAAASELGAVVTAVMSRPATGTLRYRETGASDWQTLEGIPAPVATTNSVNRLRNDPVDEEREATNAFRLVFPLTGLLKKKTAYEFQLEAEDGAQALSRTGGFKTEGAPKKLFVAASTPSSAPTAADGSDSRPFPRLQTALDRALPGDTVELAKGVYTLPSVLAHGGLPEAPIRIRGAGADATVLDGGRKVAVLLEISHARHVIVEGMQVRWFLASGILIRDSEAVRVERCRFLNRPMASNTYADGQGILIHHSPGVSVSHCVFARLLYGMVAQHSPSLVLEHNTAFKNLYSSAFLVSSSRNSRVRFNSFGFANISSLYIKEPDLEAFTTLELDDNNYGGPIRKLETDRPDNDFAAPDRYGLHGGGKTIVSLINDRPHDYNRRDRINFNRMEHWQSYSGKDQHSLFSDPCYVDPLAGDFNLLPESPNLLRRGKTTLAIGAMAPHHP